jgi:PAS domain S-box-containing protein
MLASLQGYAAAIGAVALAFAVRALLDPILADNVPFVTFFAAAAIAAWYGGVGPGILAVTLGFLAAHHAFVSPGSDLATRRVADLVAGVAYFATSGTIVALCATLRRSIQRSRDAMRDARASERERDRTAEALLRTEARLAAIVESSDDAIVGKTLEGIVTSWNGGAQRIFGYTAQEMIGQPIFRLAPPDRPDEIRAVLEQIRRGKRVEHFETERIRKDGERIHVSLTVSPITDSTGRIVGASKVARDVSDRKRIEQERELLLENAQRARAEAEAASRAKDAFLATVSHELRTPLSPILAWSTMLRQGALDASKTERALETIERCARNQAQLVEDLLDVSRIVAGKLHLAVRPVDLGPVVRAALDVVRPAAEAKEILLQVVLDPDGGQVSGDPERLQQVVWNLLSNAVKFTPRGGRVRVVLERVGSHLEIAVSDSGQGIAPDFLPYVFERFRQADGTTTRAHAGLGLGLAIVRHIVELHGGSVHAESPGDDGGAAFTVKLPLLPPARSAGEGERLHPIALRETDDLRRPSLEGLRILVVDDDPDSNEVVRMLLSSCQAEIEVAGSVAQAIDALRRFDAHLLVSDIGMPVQDGYALIRKVRESDAQRSRPLPAIALTAYGSIDDRVRLFSAGFQAHLTKPVDPAELLALVASLARSPGPD